MTIDWSEWGPPLAVLVAGLIGGLAYARATRGSDLEQREAERLGRREDLRRAKDGTLEALRALEFDRTKLDPEDYDAQRKALLAMGADALRGLDEVGPGPTPDASKPAHDEQQQAARALLESQRATLGDEAVDAALAALDAKSRRATSAPETDEPPAVSPAWQGAAWALLAVALIGTLWWNLGGSATERGDGSMTGNTTPSGGMGSAPATPGAEPEWPGKRELEARLAADPGDLGALNDLTEIALGQQDLSRAMTLNSQARTVSPDDPDARVYFALLRMSIGQVDEALTDLDAVLAQHPTHGRALAYKGLILLNQGQPDAAATALQQAIDAGAPGRPALEQELIRARAMAMGGDAPPAPMPTAPHPPLDPAPAGDALLAGTITVPVDIAGRLSGSEVVFVSLRDPAGGPPLAALRLPPGPFPLAFRVKPSDVISMGGAPRTVPETVDVSVRIDLDGNAMTRSDGEPSFTQQGVRVGTTELGVALQ